MRIRQIKPAFWSDKVMAHLPVTARLAYIGLWMLADDAGWIEAFDLEQAGAELFPFEPAKKRERALDADVQRLIQAGRVVRHDCGCLHVPHLEEHQRISGIKNLRARDAHLRHCAQRSAANTQETHLRKQQSLNDSPGTVGNGTGSNGTVACPDVPTDPSVAGCEDGAGALESAFREAMKAAGHRPQPKCTKSDGGAERS